MRKCFRVQAAAVSFNGIILILSPWETGHTNQAFDKYWAWEKGTRKKGQ